MNDSGPAFLQLMNSAWPRVNPTRRSATTYAHANASSWGSTSERNGGDVGDVYDLGQHDIGGGDGGDGGLNGSFIASINRSLDGADDKYVGMDYLDFLDGTEMVGGGGVGSDKSIFRLVIHYMDVYVVPLIALVGVVGNLLSFTVFVLTYMRRSSSSIYLAALSLADAAFLVCVLVSWGVNTGVNVYAQDGWCQTFIFLTYVSSFLSVWYVVSFTVERYIAVYFPLKRQVLCTTRRAKAVVISLAVFAALLYSFGTWTSGVTIMFAQPMCGPLPQYYVLVSILNNIDTVTTLILPFLAILGMNVKIVWRVVQFYRERKRMATGLEPSEVSTSTNSQCQSTRQSTRIRQRMRVSTKTREVYTRAQVRVTKMLLTVSSIFLVLNLPRHTARTYSFFMTLTDKKYEPTPAWQKAFEILYYMHFSVNLFLYSALGKNFRKALLSLGRRIRHNVTENFTKCSVHCRRGRDYIAGHRDVMMYDYNYKETPLNLKRPLNVDTIIP